MILLKLFCELNQRKVRYLVVGGVAGVLHGNPRFTKDLDLFVDMSEANLKKLVSAFNALKFTPRVPVKPEDFISEANRRKWMEEKNMLAFTFINPKNPFENVDILLSSPISFEDAYKEKEQFVSGGIKFPVISKSNLIQMKEIAGRYQDLEDIKILKSLEDGNEKKS